MKVQATWHHVFEVSREVDVDEDEFKEWKHERYGEFADDELALAVWIDQQDTEFTAEVFHDWRLSTPLPSDFELLYSDVADARVGGSDA
ncbi:hypothetical protein [Microbacterium jejuense]|uniref:hypothetical protein n=1 Tax=Microbacterium jejuense TaxID=1263637 RepID=UPI0031EC56EA